MESLYFQQSAASPTESRRYAGRGAAIADVALLHFIRCVRQLSTERLWL